MKLIHAQIAEAQRNHDAVKRELINAAVNSAIEDEEVLALREELRKHHQILRELDERLLSGLR